MTPAEAVQYLDAMASGDNEETAHEVADAILLRMLRTASPELQAVAHAWERANARVGFWYA